MTSKEINKLTIGDIVLDSPVVLAPMAGITNTAFRRLCSEFGDGLFVSEMITSRALVERNEATMRLVKFHESETPRSIQLYGVDPKTVGEAVRIIVNENLADHIDLNFGCPVPKVTRKGGGAALPWKEDLFAAIVQAAVTNSEHLPVTVKMRKGIDDEHLTFLDSAKAAEDAGAKAVALHARTANQHYSGEADWHAIELLKNHITSIPVLGNGDIWDGSDAVRMVEETGCDGVVVGRGCLGRPWLFADLEASFKVRSGELTPEEARQSVVKPKLGEVLDTMKRHMELLIEFFEDETRGSRDFRKHIGWYMKGYGVGGDLRKNLALVDSLADFEEKTADLDREMPYPEEAAEGPRGRAGSPKRTVLPEGWLNSRRLDSEAQLLLQEAELDTSGG